MTPKFEYSTPSNPEDIQQLGYILDQCFVEPGESENYFNRIGDYNLRVIRRSGQIVGGLAIIPMGQWWGGLLVPMMGIAGVGIAPECRGSGAALALMQDTLKELHSKGVPISVLYPATQRLYRKVGYEQAGTICGWEIPTDSIQILKQPLSVKAVPVDYEVFRELYLHQARLNNGNLDRHSSLWIPVISTDKDEKIYAYLIGTVDQPQGYIIFSQKRSEASNYIQVKDWVAVTTAAVQTFWAFLASHRSQIDKVRWKSSAIDSLTLLLLEQTVTPRFVERWLLRVVDVQKALEKRGYPEGIQGELHLEVRDELIAENNGKFILSVANGRGEVTKGGKGELQLDIRGLAPLYTNLFAPSALQVMGQLEGTETAISTATQIFTGSSPWMPDFF